MFKQLGLFSFLLFIISNNAFAIQLQIEDSKILALWSFVLGATSSPNGSATSVEFYQKSSIHSVKTDKLLNEAAEIIETDLNQGFDYKGQLSGRFEQSWDGKKHFLLQAAIAKNLSDFKLHTSDLLPYSKHKRLFEILNELMPLYEKLIWKPSFKKMLIVKKQLRKDFDKLKNDQTLEKIQNFYHSEIDTASLFKVHLIPVPGSRGGTHATVVSNEIFAQFLLDGKELDADAGTLVHETSHYLYETQNSQFQEEHLKWFNINNSEYGKYLYQSWDEILATVLGNGYGYEVVKGHEDKNEWYQNHEFETISRAIYPMVKDYLRERKKLDQAFVEAAINKFETLLPNAKDAYFRIFKSTFLIMDDSLNIKDIKNPLKRIFHYSSLESKPISLYEEINHVIKRGFPERYPDEPYRSLLIVSENLSKNNLIDKLNIPSEIKEKIKLFSSNKPGYFVYKNKESLPIVLIQGKTESEFANIDRVLRKNYAFSSEQGFHEVYDL